VNPNDVNNLLLALTGVLVLLTGGVTWFAWRTVQESQKATAAIRQTVTESNKAAEAAKETVAALKELLILARDTAVSSAESVEAARRSVAASQDLVIAARETIDIGRAAHAADERDRKIRQLRDIGQLAEALFWKAADDSGYVSRTGGWRVVEHNYLTQALVGLTDELPKCVELTQANFAENALGMAASARTEVEQALRKLQSP
jgi:methionine synthase II (cobalamin-independent)